ncbi:MAG: hypothetical protein EZS28_008202 [Streblomastix strix]|uniref:Uncharacterized protein n=2 Tax=Streblomastix strix TaxID=222440 RepID=A0A5J4WN03_9EUKA|nr:MAG: hypothetical protein EZS28_008202 [Streblomastix strix]
MHSMRHPVLDKMFHLIDLDQSSENDLINFDREVIRFDLVVTLHLKHVYCIMTQGHYYMLYGILKLNQRAGVAGFKDVKSKKFGHFEMLMFYLLFSSKSASEYWQLSNLLCICCIKGVNEVEIYGDYYRKEDYCYADEYYDYVCY